MILFAEKTGSTADRGLRIALYVAWLALLVFLASRHVFWRDEVRAFTIALQGETVWDMLRGLHGEGHPALWYLLLRGADALVPVREVLPAVAVLVCAAAMAILVFRSPFRPSVITLILFGAFGLFEYGVVARNYGLAMLLLFALAALYPRYRDRGAVLGLLLLALCNTNVPAVFLAAAFLLFWLIELVGEDGLRWTPRYLNWIVNAALAALGALLCFLEVYPTVHDAAVTQHPDGIGIGTALQALVTPALSFPDLKPWVFGPSTALAVALALIIFGSLIGLMRSPGAFIASLAVTLIFELFFQLVYPGSYRHQALLLVWLVTMYWLAAQGRGGRFPMAERSHLPAIGATCFALLLAFQLLTSVGLLGAEARDVPYSRARDLARLLEERGLERAVLVADPDVLLEPLPYYSPNPIYLLREQKFGRVVRFTRKARMELSLGDVLNDVQRLQTTLGRPVVIVLQHRLDPAAPAQTVSQGYIGSFATSPEQVRDFLASTQRLARFAPAITDESYDVYLLRQSVEQRLAKDGAPGRTRTDTP